MKTPEYARFQIQSQLEINNEMAPYFSSNKKKSIQQISSEKPETTKESSFKDTRVIEIPFSIGNSSSKSESFGQSDSIKHMTKEIKEKNPWVRQIENFIDENHKKSRGISKYSHQGLN